MCIGPRRRSGIYADGAHPVGEGVAGAMGGRNKRDARNRLAHRAVAHKSVAWNMPYAVRNSGLLECR